MLANWAVRNSGDTVLEPSFGGCGFLAAAHEALKRVGAQTPTRQIYGCDVDPVAFGYLTSVLGSPLDTTGYLLRDFLDCIDPPEWPRKFSVVLANPPYIPHHRIGRDRVRELWDRVQGVPGTGGRSSLWAYFISHSLSMLAAGGRMAWVLPGAFLQADYAGPLRTYLAARFDRVAALIIRDRLFLTEGTDEETVILLADGYRDEARDGAIELGEAQTLDELETIILRWSDGEWTGVTTGISPATLSMTASATARYEALTRSAHRVILGELANVAIGLVTGANEFFVLKSSQLADAGLEELDCLPVLSKFRAAPGVSFRRSDLEQFALEGGRSFLISSPGGPQSARVNDYLESFGDERRAKVSTFRKRSYWSQTTDGNLPHAFFPVMHHTGPRLVLNELGCHCTNTLHRVFFRKDISPATQMAASVSILSTFSQISAELVGRRYGSGVLKHEPRDAERIALLMPPFSEVEVTEIFHEVDHLLRTGRPEEAQAAADIHILERLGVEDVKAVAADLNTALANMRARRRPRRS